MGATESKPKPKDVSSAASGADLLDMIAAKYILTQNFKDMEKLSQKAYCDKLVILTSDIIKKYMNEKTIKYLAEKKGTSGVPQNYMTQENVMYLDTSEIDSSAAKQRFSKQELDNIQKAQDAEISRELLQKYMKKQSGGESSSYSDILRYLGRSGDRDGYSRKIARPRKRSVLSELDVRNSTQKQRMCKGIARFYISIAHLYAAIVQTVNPVYVWKDPSSGARQQASIMNRSKIPKGVTPVLTTKNICTNRINVIEAKDRNDDIEINLSKVCDMNLNRSTVTRETNPYNPTQWGNVVEDTKTLLDEPGIPQLRELYNDYYDYSKGQFTRMTPGGQGEKQYKADLKEFYNAFTGGFVPYEEWNKAGDKTFADIKLENYGDKEVCKTGASKYRRTFVGKKNLFGEYAKHLKQMMTKADQNRKAVLGILDDVFKLQTIENQEKFEIVTLNPNLDDNKLMDIIATARKAIVKLYIDCENDFKEALRIFNGLTMLRSIDNTIEQEKAISAQVDAKYTDSTINNVVLKEVARSLSDPKVEPEKAKGLASSLSADERNKLILALLAKK